MEFPIQIIVMSYLLESCARSCTGFVWDSCSIGRGICVGFVLDRAQDLCGIRARSGTGFVWDSWSLDQTEFRITP